MVPHESYGLLRDAARLGGVAPGLECPLHPDKIDRKRGWLRRRESDQLTTAELLVRKPDQTLTAASVMPSKRTALAKSLLTAFENGFVVKILEVVVVAGRSLSGAREKVGRGQLLLVADDHDLLRSKHRAERVLWPHLRSFVDHQDVEAQRTCLHEFRQR
jgi:hypothetical protein